MDKNNNEILDEVLVQQAGETVIGTPSGLKAQHAQAELTRRLIKALNDSRVSSEKYNEIMLVFTIVLFLVGFVQLVVSINNSAISNATKIIELIIFLSAILLPFYLLLREVINKHKK